MLDIHTHLYFDSFDADREATILRAREAGIKQMIVVGCDLLECQQAVDLAGRFDDMYASVGIHPNEFRRGGSAAGRALGELLAEIEAFADDKKVVAIGECGLDYSESHGGIDGETKILQQAGFVAHLELAAKLKLPVIIHCREAYHDMLAILKDWHENLPAIILHCYMGDTEVTRRFLELPNLYFSFTGNITYPVKKGLAGTKDDLTETVRLIPKERLFVETDCPFLSPQAKRGERNEPAYAIHTAEKACELLGLTRPVLDAALEENFKRVFQSRLR